MKNQLTNSQAHSMLTALQGLFEEYNLNGLTEFSPTPLEVEHQFTMRAFDLVKFLYAKEQTEATKAYMIFTGKLLLRFSYLREHGRKETSQETAEYFKGFTERHLKPESSES
jgi:hypothetical protein